MNAWGTTVAELLGEQPQLPIRLHGGLRPGPIDLEKTALLCVDMQEHVATPRLGPKAEAAKRLGLERELEYYWSRLERTIDNLALLQETFRRAGREVVHTMGALATLDGRDRGRAKSRLHAGRSIGGGAPEEARVSQAPPIVVRLAPLPNELVFRKNGSTAFGMTRIDLVLWNLGIETLVVGGVVTNQCVEATVRGAFDHGFSVVLLHDATATYSEELQNGTLRSVGDWFCQVAATSEVASWFGVDVATGAV